MFQVSLKCARVSCAASIATIDVIEREEGLVENAEKMGAVLKKRLEELKDSYEIVGDVRGKGLILGVEFVKNQKTLEPATVEVAKICYRAWELGLILGYVGMFSRAGLLNNSECLFWRVSLLRFCALIKVVSQHTR